MTRSSPTSDATAEVRVVCRPYGDAGLLADLVHTDYETRWGATQSLGERLREAPPPGFVDVVASYDSVFVAFDPLVTDHAALEVVVRRVAGGSGAGSGSGSRTFVVPVLYGGDAGPDLQDVADLCDLTPEQVVEAHTAEEWTVRFVGSPVGAPMMDGPRLPRSVPRLATPRARVVPGSVAVSGLQSMVYNAPSPGGWRVLGLTPAALFDLHRPPHVAYRPGDRFSFRPITAEEWDGSRRPLEVLAGDAAC